MKIFDIIKINFFKRDKYKGAYQILSERGFKPYYTAMFIDVDTWKMMGGIKDKSHAPRDYAIAWFLCHYISIADDIVEQLSSNKEYVLTNLYGQSLQIDDPILELHNSYDSMLELASECPSSNKDLICNIFSLMRYYFAESFALEKKNGFNLTVKEYEDYCSLKAGTLGRYLSEIYGLLYNLPRNKRVELNYFFDHLYRSIQIFDDFEDILDDYKKNPNLFFVVLNQYEEEKEKVFNYLEKDTLTRVKMRVSDVNPSFYGKIRKLAPKTTKGVQEIYGKELKKAFKNFKYLYRYYRTVSKISKNIKL